MDEGFGCGISSEFPYGLSVLSWGYPYSHSPFIDGFSLTKTSYGGSPQDPMLAPWEKDLQRLLPDLSWLVVNGCHEFGIFPEMLGISHHPLIDDSSYFSEGWPNHQPEYFHEDNCRLMSTTKPSDTYLQVSQGQNEDHLQRDRPGFPWHPNPLKIGWSPAT